MFFPRFSAAAGTAGRIRTKRMLPVAQSRLLATAKVSPAKGKGGDIWAGGRGGGGLLRLRAAAPPARSETLSLAGALVWTLVSSGSLAWGGRCAVPRSGPPRKK